MFKCFGTYEVLQMRTLTHVAGVCTFYNCWWNYNLWVPLVKFCFICSIFSHRVWRRKSNRECDRPRVVIAAFYFLLCQLNIRKPPLFFLLVCTAEVGNATHTRKLNVYEVEAVGSSPLTRGRLIYPALNHTMQTVLPLCPTSAWMTIPKGPGLFFGGKGTVCSVARRLTRWIEAFSK